MQTLFPTLENSEISLGSEVKTKLHLSHTEPFKKFAQNPSICRNGCV
jgi:hypothetical protein